MVKYFDLPDMHKCAEVTVEYDTESESEPAEMLERAFRTPVREVSFEEYESLRAEYDKREVSNDSRSKGSKINQPH